MRIRKNAKISAFLYTNSNISTDVDECTLQKNLCQLNQSPWDIITFPSSDSSSSFYQFDDTEVCCNVNLAGNVSSIDPIGDFDSMASKTLMLGENGNINGRDDDCNETLGFNEEVEKSDQIQEEIKLCCKRDEKGWQCRSVVKNGNTMCDHHVLELQNQAVWTTKKKSGPRSRLTTGARPCRAKKRPTLDPHEFYYYSGFGPSWGKKRGSTDTTSNMHYKATSVGSDSNTSSIIIVDMKEETGKRFEPDMSKVEPLRLDCVDDDDDYEEDDREIGKLTQSIRKKRGRKPIKERSLKSLM